MNFDLSLSLDSLLLVLVNLAIFVCAPIGVIGLVYLLFKGRFTWWPVVLIVLGLVAVIYAMVSGRFSMFWFLLGASVQ